MPNNLIKSKEKFKQDLFNWIDGFPEFSKSLEKPYYDFCKKIKEYLVPNFLLLRELTSYLQLILDTRIFKDDYKISAELNEFVYRANMLCIKEWRVNDQRLQLRRKKIEKQLQHKNNIYIREIIIADKNVLEKYGEFNTTDAFYKTETKFELIERIEEHLSHLMCYAEAIHLEHNFKKNKNILKGNKKNHITRLNTCEFYFYPNKSAGPFSEADFKTIINIIAKIATKSLPNLHLALGSFPVVDNLGLVHNTVVYVQCGPSPKINIFEKANHSRVDLLYAGTKNSKFSRSIESENYIKAIQQIYLEIIIELKSGPEVNPTGKINKLFELLQNPKFKYLESKIANGVDINFKRVENFLTALLIIISKSKYLVNGKVLENFNNYIDKIVKESDKVLICDLEPYVPMAGIPPLSKNSQGSHFFGGHIDCETEGKEKFTTVVDICLDHPRQWSLLQTQLQLYLAENNLTSASLLADRYSHLILSNYITTESGSMVSPDFTHASFNEQVVKSNYMELPKIVKDLGKMNFGHNPKAYVFDEYQLALANHSLSLINLQRSELECRYQTERYSDSFSLPRTLESKLNSIYLKLQELFKQTNNPILLRKLDAIFPLMQNIAIADEDIAYFEEQLKNLIKIHKFLIDNNLDHPEGKLNNFHLNLLIAENNLEVIRYLYFQKDPDIRFDFNLLDESGELPLNTAVSADNVEIFKFLLKHGANPNLADNYNWCPMHHALERNNREILIALEQGGANMLSAPPANEFGIDKPCRQPAVIEFYNELAERNKFLKKIDKLLHQIPDLGPLDQIVRERLQHLKEEVNEAYNQHREAFRNCDNYQVQFSFLQKFVNDYILYGYHYGNIHALTHALIKKDKEIILFLMDDTANYQFAIDVNKISTDTFPINYAIQNQDIDLVKRFINRGAQLNLEDEKGLTTGHYAAESKNLLLIKLLDENNTDFFISDEVGSFCAADTLSVCDYFRYHKNYNNLMQEFDDFLCDYMQAASVSDLNLLLGMFLEIKSKLKNDFDKNPALFNNPQLYNNVISVLKYLTDPKYLSWDSLEYNGETATHVACRFGYIKLLEEVLKKKPDINAKNTKGLTAAHISTIWNKLSVLKILHQNAADFNTKTPKGFRALDIAEDRGYSAVVNFLKPYTKAKVSAPYSSSGFFVRGGKEVSDTCQTPSARFSH